MQEKAHINIWQNNTNVLHEYKTRIFDAENWFWKEIYQIAEGVYDYEIEDENAYFDEQDFFNITLLEKIGGLAYQDFQQITSHQEQQTALKKAWEKARSTIRAKIKQIQWEYEKLKNESYQWQNSLEEEIFVKQREILLKSLLSTIYSLEQALLSLPFEMEKSWYHLEMSLEEKQEQLKKIENLDQELFYEKMSNNPKQIELAYRYLKAQIEKLKLTILSQSGKQKLNTLQTELIKIQKLLPKDYIESDFQEVDNILPDWLETTMISRDDFITIFNHYCTYHWMNYKAILDPHSGSINDKEDGLHIPTDEKRAFFSLKRVLELLWHEVTAHTINLFNTRKLNDGVRGSKNIEAEEGLAMLIEYLFKKWQNAYSSDENGNQQIDISKVPPTQFFPKFFVAENSSPDELMNFLQAYEIIEPDTTSTLKRFLRLKRGRPLYMPGVQKKDLSYPMWLYKTVQLVNKGIFPELFYAKTWFEDMKCLLDIYRNKNLLNPDFKIIKPVMLHEKILHRILQINGDIPIHISFPEYMKEKYPFITLEDLWIEVLQQETKQKTENILQDIPQEMSPDEHFEAIISVLYTYLPNVPNKKALLH